MAYAPAMAGPKRWRRDQQPLSPRQWVSHFAVRTGVLTSVFLACLYAGSTAVRAAIDEDRPLVGENQRLVGPLLVFAFLGGAIVAVALLIAHLLVAHPALRRRPNALPLIFAYIAATIVGVLALTGFALGPGLLVAVPASVTFGGATFTIARGVAHRMPPYPTGLSIRQTDAGDRPLGLD